MLHVHVGVWERGQAKLYALALGVRPKRAGADEDAAGSPDPGLFSFRIGRSRPGRAGVRWAAVLATLVLSLASAGLLVLSLDASDPRPARPAIKAEKVLAEAMLAQAKQGAMISVPEAPPASTVQTTSSILDQPLGSWDPREAAASSPVRVVPAARRLELPTQLASFSKEADGQADGPRRNLNDIAEAREVQQRLADLGYLRTRATGLWGAQSRDALRGFKIAHQLPGADSWDAAAERALFPRDDQPDAREPARYVGVWAPDASACSPASNRKGLLPAVIEDSGAWAGEASCSFRKKELVDGQWKVSATCSSGRRKWTTDVRLTVDGNQLTWASQRGSQTYVRCQRPLMVAHASP